MKFQKKSPLLKFIIFSVFVFAFAFGVVLNAHAQNLRKDNFFADIKSIDLDIGLSGDNDFCAIREGDIRSAVGYTLVNTPLRRVDGTSRDILSISIITLKATNTGGASLGCAVAIGFEFWRFVNFKGSNNLVTVWSRNFLQIGSENSISRQVNSVVERTTKEFVAKWAEQN
jgi:hypothetical protein